MARTGVDGRPAALGGRLLRLRMAAGLAPGDVAVAAGLDPARYARIEAGDVSGLTYLDLLRLAEVLRVHPAAVLAD
jgi:transcriptional regulator with XRE-family HTH domain